MSLIDDDANLRFVCLDFTSDLKIFVVGSSPYKSILMALAGTTFETIVSHVMWSPAVTRPQT